MTDNGYKAWRISYQSSEQAAFAAFQEMIELRRTLAIIQREAKKQHCTRANIEKIAARVLNKN